MAISFFAVANSFAMRKIGLVGISMIWGKWLKYWINFSYVLYRFLAGKWFDVQIGYLVCMFTNWIFCILFIVFQFLVCVRLGFHDFVMVNAFMFFI